MIKRAEMNDLHKVAEMAVSMWDENTIDGLYHDFNDIMSTGKAQIFLAYEDMEPVGFAQCQLRYDYVEGSETSPVGYLEGIFVKEEYRNKGYAKELLKACEQWAKFMGCQEFASDCELANTASYKFHMALHFEEANRIISFIKKL